MKVSACDQKSWCVYSQFYLFSIWAKRTSFLNGFKCCHLVYWPFPLPAFLIQCIKALCKLIYFVTAVIYTCKIFITLVPDEFVNKAFMGPNEDGNLRARNTNWRGSFCTIDLLIMVDCLVKKVNIVFNIKSTWSKLVNTRGSNVLILPPW